ncbi:hypothetical protein T440DRAFT_472383 [Plenodomus tracheiphilus IPT5]|uniref:Uncharacterized protein n=1 Tax=Plenodomus tracheiphilus IPT5 TaxID=1408161 RepID=A0A6A7AUD4_9PLEO|nr:hypothetical protein T440DRAFT_472383 [Plenodomus tracheiphilus IPT5]
MCCVKSNVAVTVLRRASTYSTRFALAASSASIEAVCALFPLIFSTQRSTMGSNVSSIVGEGTGKCKQVIERLVPPLAAEDPDCSDTSIIEPKEDEVSDSEWVEVDEAGCLDESLADDGRTGRRKMANGNWVRP